MNDHVTSKEKQRQGTKILKVRRPFWYKVLVVGCLILSWFGFLRLHGTITNWDLLSSYMPETMLVYLAASGTVWGIVGLTCSFMLWTGMQFASIFVRVFAACFFVWYWLDRILITRSSTAQTNLVFALITSILTLLFALLVPALTRVKKFLASRKK